jgi:hypothetical protein
MGGEKGVVLIIAQDKRAAKVSLDYAEGVLDSTPCCANSSSIGSGKSFCSQTASHLKCGLLHFVALEVRPALRLSAMRLHFGDPRKAQILTPRFFMRCVRRSPLLAAL